MQGGGGKFLKGAPVMVNGYAVLVPGAAQRFFEPYPLVFPAGVLRLDPLLDVLPLGFELFGSLFVLALRNVQGLLSLGTSFTRLARSFSNAASSLRRSASRRFCSRSKAAPAFRDPFTPVLETPRRAGFAGLIFFGWAPSSSKSGRSACSAKGPLDPAGRFSTTPGFAMVAATMSGSSVSLACPW